VEVIARANPKRIEQRVKNRVAGRLLGSVGFWVTSGADVL
jgi:hypothetical protein